MCEKELRVGRIAKNFHSKSSLNKAPISFPEYSLLCSYGAFFLKSAVATALLFSVTLYCDDAIGQERGRHDRLEDRFSQQLFNRQRPGGNRPDEVAVEFRFRTIDGTYNNINNRIWGAARTNLMRKAPQAYVDGFSEPPRMNMPSGREISNAVFEQTESIINDRGLTDMVWQWGQFLDHDIDLTETHLPLEAFPILVPSGDPYFDPDGSGTQLIFSFRSLYNLNTGVDRPRQQINEITHWIDGSNIYGSEEETAHELRLFRNGMLRVSANETGQLLPVGDDGFFLAGDIRANEQVYLTSMHTLFMREHNRICRQLMAANPALTDEQLYQNARKRVVAIIQSITYNEFLPALLGENTIRRYRGYNDRVFPDIANTFSTAAYRFGHSMLSSTLLRLDADMNEVEGGHLNLANAFFNPQEVKDYGIEPYLNGLMNQKAQEIDSKVIDDIRNFLFGLPGSGGFDLASLNIQRGRDHGLPSINTIRWSYGLPLLNSFADLTSDESVRSQLREVYPGINHGDPWVLMLAEDHAPGASVGPTVQRILRDQFERLRDGDRYWYQREFSGQERSSFENTRLSNVIRRNTSLTNIRVDVFRMP